MCKYLQGSGFVRIGGVVLILAAAANGDTGGQISPGIYTGWAYVKGGGDMPLRLEYRGTGKKPTIAISYPHWGSYGLPTQNARIEGDALRFDRKNKEGNTWQFSATYADETLIGDADLKGGDFKYEFELFRADEPIEMQKLEDFADYVGTYRSGNGRSIVISNWFWGELRFFDALSGREGTLFETPEGDFFAGAANYVPAPVFARLRFARNAQGEVETLTWTQTGSGPEQLQRLRYDEHSISFESGDAHLKGTLITPAGSGPFPLVIVIGGSGWRTRSGVRSTADIFVSFGLAAFVYDKRGFGESSGDQTVSFQQTADDACAAIQTLAKRKNIDPDQIGLYGASRGGWLAPLAAARCSERVDFLVLFVAPAVSPAEQETTRRLNQMREDGYPETEIAEAAAYLNAVFAATESDEAWAEYERALATCKDKKWLNIAGMHDGRDTDDFRWHRMNMRYAPVPTLEQIKCPVLALFGENDSNVTPEQNVPLMMNALKRAGNDDFSIKVIPGANHGLRPQEPGKVVRLHNSKGYVPDVWTTVRDWLAAHVKNQAGQSH